MYDKKITNIQEYDFFLKDKLKKTKINFPFDIIEFINLQKEQELSSKKFLELLPQINYNNITFYENLIKDLPDWINNWKNINKTENTNSFCKDLFFLITYFIESEKKYFKIYKKQFMDILENMDLSSQVLTAQFFFSILLTKNDKLLTEVLINPKLCIGNITDQFSGIIEILPEQKEKFKIRKYLETKKLFNELPFINEKTINNFKDEINKTDLQNQSSISGYKLNLPKI